MTAPDTAKNSIITDHAFQAPFDADGVPMWWERCSICRLAESAHKETMMLRPQVGWAIQARRAAASE